MTQSINPSEHESDGLTRAALIKRGLVGAGALSGAAMLAACGDSSSNASTGTGTGTASGGGLGRKRKVIWAVAALQPSFLPIEIGFIESCKLLGWNFQKVGVPVSQYSPEAVVSTIRQATQARPDVIVTPGWVEGAYTAIAEAQKQGIFVLLNDADNDPAASARLRLGHVGSDEKANGVVMGQALVKAAKAKGKTSGTFVFGNPFPGNANLEAHGAGLKEAVGGDYQVIEYREPVDPADAISGWKAQITKVGGDLVGIETTVETPVAQALRESGKQPGDVLVGTFNDVVTALDLLKQGWVTTIVAHQMYAWGFLPPMLAFQALERGVAPRSYVNAGEIVTADTVDAYREHAQQREDLAKQYGVKLA